MSMPLFKLKVGQKHEKRKKSGILGAYLMRITASKDLVCLLSADGLLIPTCNEGKLKETKGKVNK